MSEELRRSTLIFGKPVKTSVTSVRYLTCEEYLLNMEEVNILSLNVLHVYYKYRTMVKDKNPEMLDELESLKEMTLHEIVLSTDDFKDTYIKVFGMVMDEPSVYKVMIDEALFMEHRQIIMTMNLIKEEEVSINPEIQEGIEISRMVSRQKAEGQSFEDIVTAIVATTSNSFEDVCNMTVYQLYSLYARIGAIFNYSTSTLFATVSGDVDIEHWSKHIDLLEKEESKSSIKRSEFDRKLGGAL